MVPWNKLPKDAQKAILALILMSGGSSLTSCCPPVVCDPPPPPRTALPLPTSTLIICDPIPPPSITRKPPTAPIICDPIPPPSVTPRRSATPVVCDPPPPPASRLPGATSTPAVVRRFQLRNLQMTSDATLQGAAIQGKVLDKQGQPLGGIKVTLQTGGAVASGWTARDGSFFLPIAQAASHQLIIGDDKNSALPLQLKPNDVATVEWAEIGTVSQAPLPLAEIRTVDILWGDGLTFQVETPWTGARYRWSVSGGTLRGENEQVAWEPPAEPGRYLLQLVADWGYEGLAVDSLVLTVNRDGSIYIA